MSDLNRAPLKWWHMAIMGGMGAAGGYLMLKDRWGKVPSAGAGAAATLLTVLAFRPGGWLRSTAGLGAVSRRAKTCKWIQVCEPSPLVPVKAGVFSPLGPYIGAGASKKITGYLRDKLALVINGTVVVKLGTTTVGHTTSAAGVFNIYDLAPGNYKLVVTTTGGKTAAKNVTVSSTGVADAGQFVVA